MAINSLSFPVPQNFAGEADFAPLANLGNVYRQGQQNRLADLAFSQMGSDPAANAQLLIKSGHPDLVPLGVKMQQTIEAQKEHQREFGITSGMEGQRIKLAQEAQEAADPTYQRQQRVKDLDEQAAQGGPVPKDWRNQREWQTYAITGKDFPSRVGLGPPSYTRDAAGNVHEFRPSSSGEPVESVYPPGQQPVMPGEIAQQKAEGLSMGKTVAAAKASLPEVEKTSENAIKLLEDLKTHKGREDATGTIVGNYSDTNPLLGANGIAFRSKLAQAKNQAFLQVYNTKLRNAGAISNVEGEKGTSAVMRISPFLTGKDFDEAVNDAEDFYKNTLERTRRAARGDFSTHPLELQPSDYAGAPTPSAGGTTSGGGGTALDPALAAEFDKAFRRKK